MDTKVDTIADEMTWTCVDGGACGASPCARGKHSATLLDGYVYVLGGRGAGGAVPLRDFWRYCLASGIWQRLECRGEAPPSLQEHTATAHGSKIYVFGGEAGSISNETPLWIYDTETQIWRKLPGQSAGVTPRRPRSARPPRVPAGPSGRRGHSAHALKDCLLIYGGYKDLRGSTNELWAFHYESESWQAVRGAAGPARHRHAAALAGTRLYVHGGLCDLRVCAELWHYDTLSRSWTQSRAAGPGARSGHAGARAGGHFYIFGGEAAGGATNEMWRFHFATETWEKIVQSIKWPSPRVDCCAILAAPRRVTSREPPPPAAHDTPPGRPAPPNSLLKEISKLSTFHIRRAARCSYTALGEKDSSESLHRTEPSISKSHSAYIIDKRQNGNSSPREGDVPDGRSDMSREPISVPDFADMILPTPVLSPVEATKLVYLDSEEEEDMRREIESMKRKDPQPPKAVVALPKSASVRFTRDRVTMTTEDEEAELSTSDYASAEKVNRLSGTSSLGFSNPHYLGPDVRKLGIALTPDSGCGPGDIELQDLGAKRANSVRKNEDTQLHLLIVGGKEPPHLALLQSPLSMWTYRLL